jgi:C_GCAxxG_C_C family probable redox protein
MSRVEKAVSRFQSGNSCAQAVFSTYAEPLGMAGETAVKVAAGFGGGMGRMGHTCGAVTGAFMALGLKYGGPESKAKEKTYELVREFASRFKARHGSLDCNDLLGCDISTSEGRQRIKQQKLHSTLCPQIVRDAAEILEELLCQLPLEKP